MWLIRLEQFSEDGGKSWSDKLYMMRPLSTCYLDGCRDRGSSSHCRDAVNSAARSGRFVVGGSEPHNSTRRLFGGAWLFTLSPRSWSRWPNRPRRGASVSRRVESIEIQIVVVRQFDAIVDRTRARRLGMTSGYRLSIILQARSCS